MPDRYNSARLTCYQELARSLEKKGITLGQLMRCAMDEFLADFPCLRALYHEHALRKSVSKKILRQLERELQQGIDAATLARQLRYLARFGNRIPSMDYVNSKKRSSTPQILQ